MPSEALLSPLSITDLAASKCEARQPLTDLPCPCPVPKMRKYPNTKPQPPGSLLLWFSTSSSYHLHCPVPTPASFLGHPNAKNETIYLGPIHLPLIQPRYLGKPICKCTRTFTPPEHTYQSLRSDPDIFSVSFYFNWFNPEPDTLYSSKISIPQLSA